MNKTHCLRGHEFTRGNTYLKSRPWGTSRCCRACHALEEASRRAAASPEQVQKWNRDRWLRAKMKMACDPKYAQKVRRAIRDWQRRYLASNKGKLANREKAKRYARKLKERMAVDESLAARIRDVVVKSRARNRVARNIRVNSTNKTNRQFLADSYVVMAMRRNISLPKAKIPRDWIEIKRLVLKIHRLSKSNATETSR